MTFTVIVKSPPTFHVRVRPDPSFAIRAIPRIVPADGEDGLAATIAVGTVTSLPNGSPATVSNVGTANAAVFNFGIPEGAQGDDGLIVEVVAGTNVSVDNTDPARPVVSSTASGELVDDTTPQLGGNLDLNTFMVGDASAADLTKLSEVTATSTELNHVDGVTSAIQTQLDGKAATSHTHTASQITDFSTAADARISAAIGSTVQAYSAALNSWAGVTRAAGFDTFTATPSSANLRSLLTDETGTGSAVFATSPTLVTPNLGTPSAITLTNATGLPVSGITSSTSTALGLGSLELGHASDTTLSRGAAGFLAVEGKRVPSPASQASGDILYRGSTEWERLAKGTALQALKMDSSATAPAWAASREVLTAARNYYVRTDGSDSNDGLANTSGGAFLTIQKALDVTLGTLDLGGYNVTINVAAGTYAGSISFASPQVGAGNITINGDTTTPSNVTTGVITVDGAGCRLFIQGLNVSKGSGGYCICAKNGGYLKTSGNNQYSSASGGHRIFAEALGMIEAFGPEIIQGTVAGAHYTARKNAFIDCTGASWTASGTAAQGVAFAFATGLGQVFAFLNSSSGTFTGPRYNASVNAVVQTNGGGASYFPGSSAGSTATGGQYA